MVNSVSFKSEQPQVQQPQQKKGINAPLTGIALGAVSYPITYATWPSAMTHEQLAALPADKFEKQLKSVKNSREGINDKVADDLTAIFKDKEKIQTEVEEDLKAKGFTDEVEEINAEKILGKPHGEYNAELEALQKELEDVTDENGNITKKGIITQVQEANQELEEIQKEIDNAGDDQTDAAKKQLEQKRQDAEDKLKKLKEDSQLDAKRAKIEEMETKIKLVEDGSEGSKVISKSTYEGHIRQLKENEILEKIKAVAGSDGADNLKVFKQHSHGKAFAVGAAIAVLTALAVKIFSRPHKTPEA